MLSSSVILINLKYARLHTGRRHDIFHTKQYKNNVVQKISKILNSLTQQKCKLLKRNAFSVLLKPPDCEIMKETIKLQIGQVSH